VSSQAVRLELLKRRGIVPVFAWDFTRVNSLDPRITFTRGSTARNWSAASGTPLLVTTASGAPRFDVDPVTGASLGLLIEEGRTVIDLNNRDMTQGSWSASSATAAKDQAGLDGVLSSASSITFTGNNGTVSQTITDASKARYLTAYLRRITGSGAISLSMDNSAFTDVSGLFGSSGYARCPIATQTLANPQIVIKGATSGDKIAVDFVDLENGTFATSPIATTSASVTRAADVCSILVSAIPGFNASADTIVARGSQFATSANERRIISLNDATSNNLITIARTGSTSQVRARVTTGGVSVFSAISNVWTGSQTGVLAFQDANFAAALGAGAVGTGATGTVPTVTTLSLGNYKDSDTSLSWCGWIERIALYASRLSNAEVQALAAQ
jgi:hypothetical protein